MNLDKYQTLTGTTVADGDTARYNAVIRRTTALLESALGYTLAPYTNLDKQELGKVPYGNGFPIYSSDPIELDDPDEQDGEYRLFPYNEKDTYIKTDPYQNVYHVKLVQPQNDDEFVTYTDLTDYTTKNARKFGKYIERQLSWFAWPWYNWLLQNLGQDNGLLIAVDADWLNCNNIPLDLQYLWADMVTYYGDPDVSVTGNIKSESVNGHSWTRSAAGGGKGFSKNGSGLRGGDLAPEQSEAGADTIIRYAGPNGSQGGRVPTI